MGLVGTTFIEKNAARQERRNEGISAAMLRGGALARKTEGIPSRFLHDAFVMPMKLGMCGFTIGAAAYVRQFRVVEVQQTFYDPPPAATLGKWRANAPPDFEFTMKAWQVITHRGTSRTYRRLRRPFSAEQLEEAGAFRHNATTLAAWQETVGAARMLRATATLAPARQSQPLGAVHR